MRSHILKKYSQSRYGHASTHDTHVNQKGKVREFMIGRLRRLPLCIAENGRWLPYITMALLCASADGYKHHV